MNSSFKDNLKAKACDAFYNELIDGRYARTLDELPCNKQYQPVSTKRNFSYWFKRLLLG